MNVFIHSFIRCFWIHSFVHFYPKGKYNVPKAKLELEVDEALPDGSGSEDDLPAEFGFGRGEDQPLRSSTPPLRSSTPENLDRGGGEMAERKMKRRRWTIMECAAHGIVGHELYLYYRFCSCLRTNILGPLPSRHKRHKPLIFSLSFQSFWGHTMICATKVTRYLWLVWKYTTPLTKKAALVFTLT